MAVPPARRVLLVEDEADIRESLQALLAAHLPHVAVDAVGTPAEALRLLAEAPPDLIVTDLKMPGMNGLDFLAAARPLAPRTPRILMTAFADLDVAMRAINEAHIESFLPKPLDPEELLAEVVHLLAGEPGVSARSRRPLRASLEPPPRFGAT